MTKEKKRRQTGLKTCLKKKWNKSKISPSPKSKLCRVATTYNHSASATSTFNRLGLPKQWNSVKLLKFDFALSGPQHHHLILVTLAKTQHTRALKWNGSRQACNILLILRCTCCLHHLPWIGWYLHQHQQLQQTRWAGIDASKQHFLLLIKYLSLPTAGKVRHLWGLHSPRTFFFFFLASSNT